MPVHVTLSIDQITSQSIQRHSCRSSDSRVRANARPVALATPTRRRRRPGVPRREERRGLRADAALRQRRQVPEAVVAVAVRHVPRPERLHGRPLCG